MATATSSQPASMKVPPRQTGGAKPIECRAPSTRPQRSVRASRTVATWVGSVTSNSRISGTGSSFRAVLPVCFMPFPTPVRMISAPSAWASFATP